MNERDIFLAAIEIADPAARAAYLNQACADNAELRAHVEELLNTHAETSQFLETPAVASDSLVDATHPINSSDTDRDSDAECDSGEAEFCKYLAPATRPGWLGRLAHYEIEEILGRGAFGIVAKAFDEKLHRVVAIKLMSPELAATSPPRKRFLREARAAASVSHPNIVAVFAVEEKPIPYIVMEFVAGETLQQRINRTGPLDVIDVVRIGRQIAEGLAAAHAANLIHRDIKPANILLTAEPNEQVKISDFGLARTVNDASITMSGFISGTPMYMSPEQAKGEVLDNRADMFSLGSVLYHVTSGRPPFRAANAMAVLKRVCDHSPRPIKDIIPTTPDWLCELILRLMAKKRDSRFQTAQEVADLLARCEKELEATGLVTSIRVEPEPMLLSRTRPSKSRHSSTMRWFTAAALLLGVSLAMWIFNDRRSKTDAVPVDPTSVLQSATADQTTETSKMTPGFDNQTVSPLGGTTTTASTQAVADTREGEKAELDSPESVRELASASPPKLSSPLTGRHTEADLDDAPHSAGPGMAEANDSPNPMEAAAASNDATGGSAVSETGDSRPEEKDAGDWVELFDGQTLDGWESTDTNPRAWHVEDGTIVVSGTGRGYLHRDFTAKDFEVSLEYRTQQDVDYGPFTRAPDIQLGKTKAIEFTFIDFASLAATHLKQDGGIRLPASSDEFTPLMQRVGAWNQVRLRVQGLSNELWFNGQLIVKQDHTQGYRIVPHHTAYTREAVRVVLQHWGPERVEFRNVRVRKLPPADLPESPDNSRVPSRVNRGGGGIGGGGGFGGGRGFGGGGFGRGGNRN